MEEVLVGVVGGGDDYNNYDNNKNTPAVVEMEVEEVVVVVVGMKMKMMMMIIIMFVKFTFASVTKSVLNKISACAR